MGARYQENGKVIYKFENLRFDSNYQAIVWEPLSSKWFINCG